MATHGNIDDLVKDRGKKQAEMAALGAQIKESRRNVAILFIDLAASAEAKETRCDEDWLGYIFGFLQNLATRASAAGGTVVKQIGDELMVTFQTVEESELFIEGIAADSAFRQVHPCKIGADYGPVYHFKFEGLQDDPYGRPVDRCSRIARKAQPEAILCGSGYYAQLPKPSCYVPAGAFSLKGFLQPQEIYLRTWDQRADAEDYLQPLLKTLNRDAASEGGFRYIQRPFSADDFNFHDTIGGRPFLLRELFNLPCLPFSLSDFNAALGKDKNLDEAKRYQGYLVNWEGYFSSYSNNYGLSMFIDPAREFSLSSVILSLPRSHLEMVRDLKKGDKVQMRGILTSISHLNFTLDYVDWIRSHDVDVIAQNPEKERHRKVDPNPEELKDERPQQADASPEVPIKRHRTSWWPFGSP